MVLEFGFLRKVHIQATVLSSEEICILEESLCVDTSSNLYNNIHACIISELKPLSSYFKVQITLRGQNQSMLVVAMVNCGTTALFISEWFVKKNRICTYLLPHQIPLYNIDGS